MEPLSQRIPPIVIIAALGLPVLVALFPGTSPVLVFGAVGCACGLIFAAIYWPAAFLVLPVFAPQFKSLPGLRSIQGHVDLTLVALCGAAFVIVIHSVFGSRKVQLVPGRFSGSSKQITAFFFFVMVVAASYLYTPAPQYGGVKLMRVLIIGTFFLLAPLYLINSEEDLRHFALTFVLLGVAQTFLLFLRADQLSGPAASTEDVDVTRIGAGWLIGMAILLLLFFDVVESPFWRRTLRLFAIPCLIAGLMTSAARGAVFATTVTAIFLFFKAYKGRSKGAVIILAAFGFLCAGVAFYFLRGMGNGKYTDKLDELIQLSEGHDTSGSAGKRLAFYVAAIHEIPQRPLEGLGVGGWSVYYFGKDERAYPHDIWLEIGTEEGLIGIFAFGVFLLMMHRANRALMDLTGTHFAVFSGLLLFMLVATTFSGDLDDDRLIWLWSGMSLAVVHFARVQLAELYLLYQQRARAAAWQAQPVKTAHAAH
jgi:O-antigen ligase